MKVDPELLKTFEKKKLGINIEEQKRLAGVAVDIVMDSVSENHFQATLKEKELFSALFLKRLKNILSWFKIYWKSCSKR